VSAFAVEHRGKRCLVVDDNPTNRGILERLLLQWGLTAVLAESGEAALALLDLEGPNAEAFDLLIVDSDMPGMDGFQFIGRYNEKRPDNNTAILMLSLMNRGHHSPPTRSARSPLPDQAGCRGRTQTGRSASARRRLPDGARTLDTRWPTDPPPSAQDPAG
jgi:CheY-like chemotaxis protein